jgi:hypothetical protein
LTLTALSPGVLGNLLRVDVDFGTTDTAHFFNLTVTQYQKSFSGQLLPLSTETFRNLVLDSTQSNDAISIINSGSALITVALSGANKRRPAQTGTISAAIQNGAIPALTGGSTMTVTLSTQPTFPTSLTLPNTIPSTLPGLAAALQSALQKVDISLANATVTVIGSASSTAWLQFKAGTSRAADFLTFADGTGTPATALGLTTPAHINVQQYALGEHPPVKFEQNPTVGTDGGDPAASPPAPPIDATGLIGDPNLKTGMYALLDVDLFNILCIPATVNLGDHDAFQVATDATNLCTTRRAMYVLDVPQHDATRDSVPDIMHCSTVRPGCAARTPRCTFRAWTSPTS